MDSIDMSDEQEGGQQMSPSMLMGAESETDHADEQLTAEENNGQPQVYSIERPMNEANVKFVQVNEGQLLTQVPMQHVYLQETPEGQQVYVQKEEYDDKPDNYPRVVSSTENEQIIVDSTDGQQVTIVPDIPYQQEIGIKDGQRFIISAQQVTAQDNATSPPVVSLQMSNENVKEELDPEDFMDVVTSYKCKFCGELFNSSQEIGSHVRHLHLRQGRNQTAENKQIAMSENPISAPSAVKEALMTSVGVGGDSVAVTDMSQIDDDTLDDKDELFLCGQCNLGYTSMDACKAHMEEDHGFNMEAAITETMMETANGELTPVPSVQVGTKVDASTQVYKNKPGRKRKLPVAPVVGTTEDNTELKKKDQTPDSPFSDVNLDDDSYDWSKREGDGKRRVRPPKHLRDNYLMVYEKSKTALEVRKKEKSKFHIKCSLKGCNTKFKTEQGLQLHESCHVKITDEKTGSKTHFSYACPECKQEFEKWPVVKNHLWKTHGKECDLYKCEHCNYETDTLFKLEVHSEVHAENKPHECSCGKSFSLLAQLRSHEANQHKAGVSGKTRWCDERTCPVCEREFTSEKTLKIHMETVHEPARTFKCPFCPYSSSRKAMTEMHIRTHTGEKPYKCDKCMFATGDHNSFRRHRMRHSGEKPYKCPHCQYTCIQTASLKTHLKRVHADKDGIYECKLCSYKTLSAQSWKQHGKDHENNLIKANPQPVTKTIRIHIPAGFVSSTGGSEDQKQTEMLLNFKNLEKGEDKSGINPKEAQLIQTALSMISQQMDATSSQDASSSQQVQPALDSQDCTTAGKQIFVIKAEQPVGPTTIKNSDQTNANVTEVVSVENVQNINMKDDMPLTVEAVEAAEVHQVKVIPATAVLP